MKSTGKRYFRFRFPGVEGKAAELLGPASSGRGFQISSPYPFRGWPIRLLPKLEEVVHFIARDGTVDAFKIGRTNDPAVRLRAYDAKYYPRPTRLIEIYETESLDHALHVEGTLIQAFLGHQKCWNEAGHAGGGVAPGYRQYVYVAVWIAG